MSVTTLCVCGLGNPGSQYEKTRHNLGARLIEDHLDTLSQNYTMHSRTKVWHAIVEIGSYKIHFVRLPQYMNCSGQGLLPYLQFYRIPFENLIVAHDDLDLPFGALRLKQGGGSGGHNGLKDITNVLKTQQYWRIRVGIGRPPLYQDVASYVLAPLSPEEEKEWRSISLYFNTAWPYFCPIDSVKIQQLWHSLTPKQNSSH